MSAHDLSLALLVVAFLQAALVVVLPELFKPLARRFFDSEAQQDEKHDIELPVNQNDREHLLGFLFRLSSLAASSASTLSSLSATLFILMTFSAVAFHSGNRTIGWISTGAAICCVALIMIFFTKLIKGDVWRVNPDTPRRAVKMDRSDESRKIRRVKHNARAGWLNYTDRMKTFKTLAPYKTAIWIAAALLTLLKFFL